MKTVKQKLRTLPDDKGEPIMLSLLELKPQITLVFIQISLVYYLSLCKVLSLLVYLPFAWF